MRQCDLEKFLVFLNVFISSLLTDVQQLLVVKEEVPPEQQEQKELWTSQEEEQLQGLREDVIKLIFTPVPVKSEDEDEEIPQPSQLHRRQSEQMGTDCGGPEKDRNSGSDTHLQPLSDDMFQIFLKLRPKSVMEL